MPDPTSPSLRLPSGFGLIRTVIPGARRLDSDDLARAAALVLARDLGVVPARVRLAARRALAHQASGDDVLIAWTEDAQAEARTEWLALADGDAVYWFGAPAGFAVGPGGCIEFGATTEARPQSLPAPLLMLIAASRGARRLVLVAPATIPDADTIALWEAASGLAVEFADATMLPKVESVLLRPPPPAAPDRRWTPVDRALVAVCAASLILLLASVVRALSVPTTLATTPATNPAATASGSTSAGLLLQRALQAAPQLADALLSADYADGRWVLALRGNLPLASIERALAVNGLVAQSLIDGEQLRLRIERRQP